MIYAHFFVAKMIWAHLFCCKNDLNTLFCCKNYLFTFFCHKKNLCTRFLSRKQFTFFFVAKTIYAHFFCREKNLCAFLLQKQLTHTFFVAKTIHALFLSRKCFLHFVRKVFARWKLPSGKFRLFGPLPESDHCPILMWLTFADLEIEESVEDRLVTADRSSYVVPLAIFLCFWLRWSTQCPSPLGLC